MSTQSKPGRRSFFTGIGALAAAGVAAKMASSPPEATAPAEAEPPPGDGYRLTEHIKKYYRTTKI
ncbi:hypothetical protein GM658_00225 [Pseudoduganella eburnea]|jgi:hypothetical protein|uniref:Formate dehydrogenase n=1 Tax=Massilia eburnea TaxID=1776165 RepID=A0A6L6QAC4_9BURK|nr:hypothetical protein [Massilia eburnea]MTW09014.1 hypothetical protein [Massilia eburnea]